MSKIEDNKIIAQRWLDLISEHQIEDICSMTAPNWKIHGALPGLTPGPDGVRQLFGSFGDIKQKWTIEDISCSTDKISDSQSVQVHNRIRINQFVTKLLF
ncbi:nuclear transport factor 2 family protein [Nostoc sp. UHCC 0302]|uniref:nuclear transport factor 2 family protein n=1 Tax=Nostoc sp. UHCC 0302 TaxID=3134896 RepID=UPI00311CD2FE